MKRLLLSAAAASLSLGMGAAQAECGNITLGSFTWQSSEAMASVDKLILTNGYGCNASTVAGDTVPTITAMIEKGQPDVIPEATPSLLGEVYTKGAAEGRIGQIGTAISDGLVSGWYIPKYLADAHPDIKTVDDAMKHPELFPSAEDPSKGAVIQGPQGWGDTVITAQLFKGLNNPNFVMVPTGPELRHGPDGFGGGAGRRHCQILRTETGLHRPILVADLASGAISDGPSGNGA